MKRQEMSGLMGTDSVRGSSQRRVSFVTVVKLREERSVS